MNTIEKLGEEETFRNIVERTITEFEDNEIEAVGQHAFYQCSKLTSASFPVATSIGNYAFQSCSKLTSVSFPVATSIGQSAFQSCSELMNVSFPVAASINYGTFQYCSALTSASFPVATSIENYAFGDCSELKNVSFPVATSIGGSAFQSCSKLTSVSFPVATSIGQSAFGSCSALTSASFPAATSIGTYAFDGCSELTALYIGIESDTVCTLSSTNAIPSNVTDIYVPVELVGSYKTATNWSSFADKIQSYEVPVSCQSLTITAEDVPGYKTSTIVHYEAVCTYSIEGVLQTGTKVFKDDVVSDTFSANPSEESSRQVEISYTFLGKTATTTITQDKYLGNPVGGKIYYIDDTADGTYSFYDAEGNVIPSVTVGDAPAMYKVLTPGTKDKYYICNTTLYPSLQWGMYGRSTGATGTAIGTGKSNTNTVMATSAATTSGTIWYQLAQNRSNSLEGCTDWFIPSRYEIEEVRKSGLLSLGGKYIWSSSENDSYSAWYWYGSGWGNRSKGDRESVFFVRAF